MSDGLVCAVSTIKDTLPNIESYVARNLAGGVDHLVIFLDDPTREVKRALAEHPNVTCVPASGGWWRGQRPVQLNDRQRINANAASQALAQAGWANWLFHVDGDEVVRVDRARLAALPATVRAVRLATREAVSQLRWEEPVRWFKRPLDESQLTLLTQLGVIDKPQNGAYFHGHAIGKSGVRPGSGAWLTLHDPIGEDGGSVDTAEDDAFQVLHFESYSGEDFVRKWSALASTGAKVRFRPGRQPILVAVQALLAAELPVEVTERYLLRIFEATTLDDLDTLRDLALLDEIDPAVPLHEPRAITDDQRAALERGLDVARSGDKDAFRPPALRADK